MAPNQKPAAPSRGGNSEELDRLEAEVKHLTEVQERILEQKRALEVKVKALTDEIDARKKSNQEAYEKLKAYEEAQEVTGTTEAPSKGYVIVATVNYKGNFPAPSKLGDIIVPRKIENGVMYENLPVKVAIAQMAQGGAFKRYMMGPLEKIEGDQPVMQSVKGGGTGVYPKHFVFTRHKTEVRNGEVIFKEVIIEESVQKVD